MNKTNDNTPRQYKEGYSSFCDNKFIVTPDVLIPRYETQKIVTDVTTYTQQNFGFKKNVRILELGTGSGCISISIALNLPEARFLSTDISDKAIEVAKQNATLHGVEKRVTFAVSDLLDQVEGNFDVLIANLPYIPSTRIPNLDPSVKDYEPTIALDGGVDGLDIYRRLFLQMEKKKLLPKLIYVEMDEDQGDSILEIFISRVSGYRANITKDAFGYDRFLTAEKNQANTGV